MLTEKQMREADLARQIALDPSPVPTTGDEEADTQVAEKIERGQAVLAEYSLWYSRRFTTLAPEIDESGVAGVLRVDSGHIAGSPAYNLAVFRKRSKTTKQRVVDCTPEPVPIELPDGARVNWHVATPNGNVFWPDVAPAWREMQIGDMDDVCTVARRGRLTDEYVVCERVRRTVKELRALLGERGAAVCVRGRVYVFNADGTRVAVEEDGDDGVGLDDVLAEEEIDE